MNPLHVVIMSGIPGSGKDTYLKKHFPQAFIEPTMEEREARRHAVERKRIFSISSADHFFMMEDGSYKFDGSKIGEAHGACLKDFIDLVYNEGGPRTIIVNNTNTTELEMAPYVAIANAYKGSVELVTMVVKPEVAAARNVHGVSLAACVAMDARLRNRKLPPFWKLKETVIVNEP